MSFFSSKKALSVCTLIADLSPNSVALGISEKTTDGKNRLVYTDRQYIAYDTQPTMKQISGRVSELLKEMSLTVRKKYTVAKACVVHSSAWSVTDTHTIDIEFPKPIVISEKFVAEAIASHQESRPVPPKSLTLVYHHLQKVRLNGYAVEKPWGRTAHHLSCDLVQASIDSSMKKLADDILLSFVHVINHIPESVVALNATRHLVPDMDRVLLVHVGGETTEVVYGNKESVIGAASAPMGVYSAIRSIRDTVHGDLELAYSHLMMDIKGTRKANKKEIAAIETACESWRTGLYTAIHSVCGNNSVPQDIVVFAVPHYMPIALYMLDSKKVSLWSGRDHHVVNLLEKKDMHMIIPAIPGVAHDFMIAAGALYVVE